MKARTKNQLQAFAQLALTVSRRMMPTHGHKFAPKTYTQPLLPRRTEGRESDPGAQPPGHEGQDSYRWKMQRLLGVSGTELRGTERARLWSERWKAETLMSVIKRKWDESLSARGDCMQQLQAPLRGVANNLHRLLVLGAFLLLAILAACATSKSYPLSFSTEQDALNFSNKAYNARINPR